jgi:cyclic pyranopterin phosphate synthase
VPLFFTTFGTGLPGVTLHWQERVLQMLIDHFGRRISYLRVAVTDRCNLRCVYCLPKEGIQWRPREELLTTDEILQVARAAASLGITRIRLTGGEPLVHPDIVEIVAGLATIPGIEDVSLTTNAMLLERLAKPFANAGLKRLNVSLDTLDPEKFARITRGGDIERLWRGLFAAESANLTPLKLNTVVVKGLNSDELPALARLSIDNPWHVRFIELMPIGNTQDWGEGFPALPDRFISAKDMQSLLVDFQLEEANHKPSGNGPARIYRIPGALGTVGFISPLSQHFCQTCNRLRLTADGFLRSCLLKETEFNIREALRNGQPLEPVITQAVEAKPESHELFLQSLPKSRQMAQIGG